MSSETTFSPYNDISLAELVNKHPCLFNTEHTLYKDLQVRENV